MKLAGPTAALAALRTSGLARLLSNMMALLASDLFNRATTFVMYALVARYLGAFDFGQLSLALTFFYTFQVLASGGLRTLLIREIAKDRTQSGSYLLHGSVVVMLLFAVAVGLLYGTVWWLDYRPETAAIILLLSVGLLPAGLTTVCEAICQGWERMELIAYVNVPLHLGKLALIFGLLWAGFGVYWLVALLMVTYGVGFLLAIWMVLRLIPRFHWRVEPGLVLHLLRTTLPFLGIEVIIAVWASIQIFMLSAMRTETEVGLFNAANQLLIPFNLVLQSVGVSLFPSMCRRLGQGIASLRQISGQLLEGMLALALPAVVMLLFLAEWTLHLLYQTSEFLAAATLVRLLVWLVILRVFTTVLGQVLLASHHERITLRIVAVNLAVSIGLNAILIQQFGLVGAALAAVATGLLNVVQHYLPVVKILGHLRFAQFIWPALGAALAMAGMLAWLPISAVWLRLFLACAGYVLLYFCFAIWSKGGLRQWQAYYRPASFALHPAPTDAHQGGLL